jgi:hypothetical protein
MPQEPYRTTTSLMQAAPASGCGSFIGPETAAFLARLLHPAPLPYVSTLPPIHIVNLIPACIKTLASSYSDIHTLPGPPHERAHEQVRFRRYRFPPYRRLRIQGGGIG